MFDVNNDFEIKEIKMRAISLRKLFIAVLIIGIGTGYVHADRQELMNTLGTKQAEFEFKDITITDALADIGKELGVKIVLSDEAQWKLPQGGATKLSASLKGYLSDCLTEMLNPFFMRYAVGYDEITIYPRAELEHIIGRPSTKQLELLKNIYDMKMSMSGSFASEHINDLISRAFKGLSFLPYDVPKRISEILKTMATDKGVAPVNFTVLLQQVSDKYKTPRWYILGMDFPNQAPVIKMVYEHEYREAVLDQVVDISFRNERADVILQRLAGWTGMDLLIIRKESKRLEEKISVDMQNIKLRQALVDIVNSIDGRIEINTRENYIRIYEPMQPRKTESVAKPKSAGSSGEGYVGKISIPIGEGEGKYFIEFMLRESDLTEGLKKLREDKIKEILMKFSKADDKAAEIAARPQSYSILN